MPCTDVSPEKAEAQRDCTRLGPVGFSTYTEEQTMANCATDNNIPQHPALRLARDCLSALIKPLPEGVKPSAVQALIEAWLAAAAAAIKSVKDPVMRREGNAWVAGARAALSRKAPAPPGYAVSEVLAGGLFGLAEWLQGAYEGGYLPPAVEVRS